MTEAGAFYAVLPQSGDDIRISPSRDDIRVEKAVIRGRRPGTGDVATS